MKHAYLLISFLLSISVAIAQPSANLIEIGLVFQQYPTGSIPGARLGLFLSEQHSIELRLGYNIVYHGDAGVHELEEGGGFGFSPGYQYHFNTSERGFFLGSRVDFWFNTVDWKDNIGMANEINGTTKIMVVQPTLIAGHRIPLGQQLNLTPTLAFGVEINTMQEGADVGQGAILLAGIQFNFQL